MTAYKVLSVGEPQEWKGTHGPMHCYRLMLEGVEKPVEINQKPTTAAPSAGETLDLELSDNLKYPAVMKGKKVAPAGGFGGGGPRPEDPKRAAAIQRMHAQKVGVEAVELAISLGLAKPTTTAELFTLVRETADWLERDVEKARSSA